MSSAAVQWLISCEHGGNRVPAPYAALFAPHRAVLETHRGYDIGALTFARSLARTVHAPLHAATVTRLLVDLNRSEYHPRLFSEFSATLTAPQRAAVLAHHYHPHRAALEAFVRQARRRVLHIGVHSFTPSLGGVVRETDVGLLYDPQSPTERAFCHAFKDAFDAADTSWRLRFNYPYRGTADGFTTYLRRRFKSNRYAGVELEMNQGILVQGAARAALSQALRRTFAAMT